MALELKFYKNNNSAWGFRLAGGADCDIPLTVVKVYKDSIAEDAGLQIEDTVVRINDTPMAGLTHLQAHDVITEAGYEFIMSVRRDENGNDNLQDEEVCDIMEGHLQNGQCDKNSEEEQDLDEKIAEAISGETEVLPDQNVLGVNFNKVDLSQSTVCKAIEETSAEDNTNTLNRKWSTFLKKPDRPKVLPKVKDDDIPKAPPYRPIIKRQKKVEANDSSEIVEQVDHFTENPIVDENDFEEICDDASEENFQGEMGSEERIHEVHFSQQDETVRFDGERYSDDDSMQNDGESSLQDYDDSDEVKIEETSASLTLEQQLAQVEAQLQALVQLPSSIRDSLEIVASQLAKIVHANQGKDVEDEGFSHSAASETDLSEQRTYEEHSERAETPIADSLEENDEEYRSRSSCSSINSDLNFSEDNKIISSVNVIDNYEEIEELQNEEEDLEAKRMEEEKQLQQERKLLQLQEAHQRRLEQRPTHPLTPLQRQRPIILPGGRRWSQPGDALPSIRKPKMTDEKICETLDNYAEVIAGHAKG